MRKLLVAALAALTLASPAYAQQSVIIRQSTGAGPVPATSNGLATRVLDGQDVAQGAQADAVWSGSGTGTLVAIEKYIAQKVEATRALLAAPLTVNTHAVTQSGTWNINSISSITNPVPVTDNGGSITVDGSVTANLGTLNGAATAAAQTAVQGVYGSATANKSVILDSSGNPLDWAAPVPVNLSATTTGGCTPYGYQSAASTNATSVKSSAGTLCSLTLINTTSTLYYFRVYDSASAPNCASATGFVKTIPVPASTTGGGVAIPLGPFGESYISGIAFCITGGPGGTDATNAAVGVFVASGYK